jgi:hypothetical protein
MRVSQKWAGGVTLGLVLLALWLWMRREGTRELSLSETAILSMEYATKGRGDKLFPLILESEVKNMNLTSANVGRIVKEIVQPRISEFRSEGGIVVERSADGSFISAMQQMRSPDGIPFTFLTQAYRTPEGNRVSFGTLLYVVYSGDRILETRKPLNLKERRLAFSRGVEKDLHLLNGMGVEKFYSIGSQKTSTWQEIADLF